MKLVPHLVPDGRAHSLVCRQGRVWGVVAMIIFTAAFGGAPVFWWWVGAPIFLWALLGLLALVVVPLVIKETISKFRAENWLVWIRPDGVSINLRTYQDRGETESDSVIELSYDEIAEVSHHLETYTTPNHKGASVCWRIHSLDIKLVGVDLTRLEEVLRANRRRPQPTRVYLGGISVRSGLTHFPVSLVRPDVIRIAWRGGHNNWVAPSLRRTLAELAHYVRVTNRSRRDRPNWRNLSDAEFDDLILELVESGNRLEATNFLVRRRGFSTTEANQFVKELAANV